MLLAGDCRCKMHCKAQWTQASTSTVWEQYIEYRNSCESAVLMPRYYKAVYDLDIEIFISFYAMTVLPAVIKH